MCQLSVIICLFLQNFLHKENIGDNKQHQKADGGDWQDCRRHETVTKRHQHSVRPCGQIVCVRGRDHIQSEYNKRFLVHKPSREFSFISLFNFPFSDYDVKSFHLLVFAVGLQGRQRITQDLQVIDAGSCRMSTNRCHDRRDRINNSGN